MPKLKNIPPEENRIDGNNALARYLGVTAKTISINKNKLDIYNYFQSGRKIYYDKENLFSTSNRTSSRAK